MTQISLSKALVIIDKERGKLLKDLEVAGYNGAHSYEMEIKGQLRLLNRLKKELSNLPDTDQRHLGL